MQSLPGTADFCIYGWLLQEHPHSWGQLFKHRFAMHMKCRLPLPLGSLTASRQLPDVFLALRIGENLQEIVQRRNKQRNWSWLSRWISVSWICRNEYMFLCEKWNVYKMRQTPFLRISCTNTPGQRPEFQWGKCVWQQGSYRAGFSEKMPEASPVPDRANAKPAPQWTRHWPRLSPPVAVVAPLW